ncbi:MAG: hypothetical protein AAF196_17940 [Planctomycetota bacterium]
MKHVILVAALAGPVTAQATQLPDAITARTWPTFDAAIHPPTSNFSGTSSSLVMGGFVPHHPGRCAVLRRGGSYYLSFQPASVNHFAEVIFPAAPAATPLLSPRQLATLPSHDGGTDSLALISTDGLEVLRYDGLGFAPLNGGPDDSFEGAYEIRSSVHQSPTGPQNYVVTFNSEWVQAGQVASDGTVIASTRIYAPPGAEVRDATAIDWAPGGFPEIGILTSTGIFVCDALGNLIAFESSTSERGRICTIDITSTPALCAFVQESGQWKTRTWAPGASATVDSSPFTLPQNPTGIVPADVTRDGHSELIVSIPNEQEVILLGTAQGPIWAEGGLFLEKHAPSATQNRTIAVVDDLDRDGDPDLIAQCDASNQLVLYSDIGQHVSGAVGTPFLESNAPQLTQPSMRGIVESEDLPTDLAGVLPADSIGLVMRFELPLQLEDHMEIRCYFYRSEGKKLYPDIEEAWGAPVINAQPGGVMDVLVPAPESLSGSADVERIIEFILFDTSTGEPAKSTVSLFGRYLGSGDSKEENFFLERRLDQDQSVWLLADYLLSPETGNTLLFDDVWGLIDIVVGTFLGPTSNPLANRSVYLGTYEPTSELDAEAEKPSGKPASPIPTSLPI